MVDTKIAMKNRIGRVFDIAFPGLRRSLQTSKILAVNQGQWRSFLSRAALNANGEPIPWYTYPAIEYLNSFDFSDCDIFEFGAGYSSMYWATRGRSVISVEDTESWYEVVKKNLKANQSIIYRANEQAYVRALAEQQRGFDIIVIDGSHRPGCTLAAIEGLQDNGFILLDNSDRVVERECGKLLRHNGFFQVDFSGFGPINDYCWSTSLFFKNSSDFSAKFFGPMPIGGLTN